MPEARPNIHELARLSGVSVGTVSRALNGYADVSKQTRERIMRIAEELDYTPTTRSSTRCSAGSSSTPAAPATTS
jgi:DNA-binding LacI/PurR family transcriptional regulator